MPQLLLELFSEEIPARMQAQAGRDLARLAEEHLRKAGLAWESLTAFAGPRRLTLVVEGLPAETPARSEEIKGPRANAPDQAIEGFLRKTGLSRENLIEREGVLYAVQSAAGRATTQIIAETVPAIMAAFPWPKSMRSGTSSFRWVRPLKRILCLFDGVVVPFEAGGVASGDLTEGHRFMGADRAPFAVTDFADYAAKLHGHYVELDQAVRKQRILDGARAVCAAAGLELVEDEGLLEEVSGLSEWPVPILGAMDPAFLDLPPEVIRTSMRTHQKYFAVRVRSGEGLAPHFVVVANIEPKDGGAVIAAGNAKVLSARLSDARFFWDEDRKNPLEDRLETLKGVTFHAKLGTMYERVERIEALAREIAPLVDADPALAAKAARLCKADLATGMVGEFPELQGVMGGYYARLEHSSSPLRGGGQGDGGDGATRGVSTRLSSDLGSDTSLTLPSPPQGGRGFTVEEWDHIADAVRDHYKPVGPSDTVPTAPVTVAVALADKLDTLVGFFAIDEKPTGSRDPFALRRAALGVIGTLQSIDASVDLYKILLTAARRVSLAIKKQSAASAVAAKAKEVALAGSVEEAAKLFADEGPEFLGLLSKMIRNVQNFSEMAWPASKSISVIMFLFDRMSVKFKDLGANPEVVRSVRSWLLQQSLPIDFDIGRLSAQMLALDSFLATEDGASLLAGYKRATNILKAEEKKNPAEAELCRMNAELSSGAAPEEAALVAALRTEAGRVDEALAAEDFTRAMQHLAHLRAPVDAFFDKVLVNDPDPAVRLNRLRLLTQVRDTANRVADFSLISG